MLESLFLTSVGNHGLVSQETRKLIFLPVESFIKDKETLNPSHQLRQQCLHRNNGGLFC